MAETGSLDRAHALFSENFNGKPDFAVRAPGRVNLIGEHTDYNGGFVLPMALTQATHLVISRRDDHQLNLVSETFPPVQIDTFDPRPIEGWGNYAKGMVLRLSDAGHDAGGLDIAIASDIPVGAGLSSSAALEMGIGLAVAPDIDRTELAHHGQWVENNWIGVPSGIMDQLIVATATSGALKLIDCRSLDLSDHPIPDGVTVVVLDTSTRRSLVGSEYAERRASCDRVAAAVGVAMLRDATLSDIEDAAVDSLDRARARHVIEENDRTIAAAEALAGGDPDEVGRLMNASHVSMRDLFDISSAALNSIVDAAQNAPGSYGARMTGGGFAGCAVALVRDDLLEDFLGRNRIAIPRVDRPRSGDLSLRSRARRINRGPRLGAPNRIVRRVIRSANTEVGAIGSVPPAVNTASRVDTRFNSHSPTTRPC